MKNLTFFQLFLLLFLGCNTQPNTTTKRTTPNTSDIPTLATTGSIERIDERINDLIPSEAKLEILAEGFDWTEGPVWVEEHQMLLFSDIPPNKIFQWTEKEGLKEYLFPSGDTSKGPFSGESGSNGLLIDKNGKLVLCQHGDRRVARMDAPVNNALPKFTTIVDRWQGKRFNSPNDAVFHSIGDLLFTDPPYGLHEKEKDPKREISFQGVYHFTAKTGEVSLLTDKLSRPNGITFSPDEKTLYVANSDPGRAIWMAYDFEKGKISNGRIFFDASNKVGQEQGLPDGLKTDDKGNLWATGPGGVLVFSPKGEHLGTIRTGQATSNCAFNADKTMLYITADMYLMRLKL